MENQCPTCGHPIEVRFCSKCGEEKLRPELRSVRYLIKSLVEDLTSIDGKIGSTLRLMLLKPGQFELNFYNGRRIDFLRPITFFLLINVMFVFFSPLTDFYVNLLDQVTLQPYSPWVKDWLDQQLAVMDMSFKEFEAGYNQVVKLLARSLIILQVPIFAVFAFLICYQKRYFFADYLVFSLNFHAWLLLWVVLLQPFAVGVAALLRMAFPELSNWQVYLTLLPLGAMVYLFIAMKRFFQFRWWSIAIRLAMLLVAYQVSHSIFRLCQFFITFYMVDVPINDF